MSDEVNLILTKLKIVSEEKENGMYLCDKKHSKILLDYITNLQEKNEDLKDRLKVMKHFKNSLQEENEDYKSRCEKAIEYIEDNTYKAYGTDYMDLTGIKELLKILGGNE